MRRSEFIQQFVKDIPFTGSVETNEGIVLKFGVAKERVAIAEVQADALEAAGIPFDPEETK